MTFSRKIFVMLFGGIFIISTCDERVPEETVGENYIISISTQPIEGTDLINDNVGEDLVGDGASTHITATVSDNNNNKIKDATLTFTSIKSNEPFGNIDPFTGVTGEDGTLSAIFRDDSAAADKVILRASYNENTDIFSQSEIQVFPDSVVWPYNLELSTNEELIFSDDSPGQATLTVSLFNKLGSPVKNVNIDFITNHGSFGETNQKSFTVVTDTMGIAIMNLNHNYDLGLAEITAYFTHEGIDTTGGLTQDTKQIIIASNANISLTSYPVSRDSEDNWVYVGEDIIGDISMTRLIATVTDYNGNPISGVYVIFKSECLGDSVGTISFDTDQTILSGSGAQDIFPEKNILKSDIKIRPGRPSIENHNNSTEDMVPEKVNLSPNKRTIEKHLPILEPGYITRVESSTSKILSGPYTNNQGQVIAYFNDLGVENFFIDFPETHEYEGVVVTAYVGDELGNSQSTQFNVYSPDIYPYELLLNTDTDEINLDNGATTATITGTLRRGNLNEPVGNVTLSISSDRGYLVEGPWVSTDSLGQVSFTFQDQNLKEDVGLATITASYTHPGFGSTLTSSVQVSIVTNYTLTLTSAPRSLNNHPIGEDIEGELARTLIIATLTDSLLNPIPGQTILFKSMSEDMEVGIMTPDTLQTDEDGIIFTYFDDGGDHYFDDPRTPEFFEGVEVTAYIGDETGTSESVQFDVWPTSVWPYHLSLAGGSPPDDYEITEVGDGSCEVEDLYVTLVSGYTLLDTLAGDSINNLISDALITFEYDIGDIEPEIVMTDSNGHATVEITNYEDDPGLSTIVARYTHPSFGIMVTDTVIMNVLCQAGGESPDITMALTTTPMYGGYIVGEDVAGDSARTHIMATLTSSDGTPIVNEAIVFGSSAGVITNVGSDSTDIEGRVFAIFDDGGVAVDNPGSPQFEGVTITATSVVASASVGINVYPETIYPYELILNTDASVILLDNGATTANITGTLQRSGLNEPVGNVTLSISSDRGYLVEGPEVTTDSTGQISFTFQDQELPEDVGMATITASYTHPGFGSTLTSSVQVSIVTNYILTLSGAPRSLSNHPIGEDIEGDLARTLITATLTDQSSNPVPGQTILFKSMSEGVEVGVMTPDTLQTDADGIIITYFDDGGDHYFDDPRTPEFFEGVEVTAYIGDETGTSESVQFDVWPSSVWPYHLSLAGGSPPDDYEITEVGDGSCEVEDLYVTLVSGYTLLDTLAGDSINNLISDALITFDYNIGDIEPEIVMTDSNGQATVEITNYEDDPGLSTIVARYTHPSFGIMVTDTVIMNVLCQAGGEGPDITMALTTTPMYEDYIVGEDVAGDAARTHIMATLTSSDGTPIVNEKITFVSLDDEDNPVGVIEYVGSDSTDTEGRVFAIFDDGGVAVDNPGSPQFEGVTITATSVVASASVDINVYPQTIYPYELMLNTDASVILLDNGATTANITGTLQRSGLNEPVGNVTLSISSDRGYLVEGPEVTTDSTGQISFTFQDQNVPEDVGMATIAASYTHPGFGFTVTDSVQVSIVTNYTLTLSGTPVAPDGTVVGEDIAGDTSRTRIVATLTDQSGSPVSGQTLLFRSRVLGNAVESMSVDSSQTDVEGKIYTYFDDGGNVYQDNPGTEDFEGVVVTSYIGSDTTGQSESVQYSVYPEDVWPYELTLNSDVDEISLDNGVTTANITGLLLNGLNQPASNLTLSFSTDRGYISSQAVTGSDGSYNLVFQDQGLPEDVGMATITASYSHPGFGEDITVSTQISIVTNYTLTLTSTPVASDNTIVGEDVVGDTARTRIVATLTDQSGSPVLGQTLLFRSRVSGNVVGTMTPASSQTNAAGQIYTFFDDPNSTYLDNPGTEDFEGVVVTAYIGNDTTGQSQSVEFNVYPVDVWPYELILNSDVDEISLDNGATTANITGLLLNKLNHTLSNVTFFLEADRGYVVPTVTSDSTGLIEFIFQDLGSTEDIGMATITGTFFHPGFNDTLNSEIQIFINAHYNITLVSSSVADDGGGNYYFVGEDVVGDSAQTRLTATVTDTLGEPISGISVEFFTTNRGDSVGVIQWENIISDGNGQIQAIFNDDDNTYVDNPGSPDFEGVTAVVLFGGEEYPDEPVQFNVYEIDDIWPYNLFLETDTDVIQLDGGETQATIVARLINELSQPVQNVQLSYSASLGDIDSFGETDSTGVDTVYFYDLGLPDEVGISNITSSFEHPSLGLVTSDILNITIEDTTFEECEYLTIPPSPVGEIMVSGGGGIESTDITAEVYDDNGVLVDTPTLVRFVLGPNVPTGAHLENGTLVDSSYTNNGVASVSLISGIAPGPVRVTAFVECGGIDVSAVSNGYIIIVTGPPSHIEAQWDPSSTEAIGAGFYRVECAAMVYDIHNNPVEDSTYIYWSIEPPLPCTETDANVIGTSLTYNENLSGDQYHGMAYTQLSFSTDGIGDDVRIKAYTWGGANGDSVGTYINDDEGGIVKLPYINGGAASVTTLLSATAHDFTFPAPTDSVIITASTTVYDYYGNPVINVPIVFSGNGPADWLEFGFEVYEDVGIENFGVGDGCFTWRDFGADGDEGTSDCGEGNYNHDAFNEDSTLRFWPNLPNEYSEPFEDCGLDGLCPGEEGYLPDENDPYETDEVFQCNGTDGTETWYDENLNCKWDEGEDFPPENDCGFDGVCGNGDWGDGDGICQDGEQYYDSNGNGTYDGGEPFEDCGFDGICAPTIPYPGIDEGENDGEWYGYHMEGCGWPDIRVRTDRNGIARVSAVFYKTLCIYNGTADFGGVDFCTYNDFTGIINATLAIPITTPADPVEIQFSRSPFDPTTVPNGCE